MQGYKWEIVFTFLDKLEILAVTYGLLDPNTRRTLLFYIL